MNQPPFANPQAPPREMPQPNSQQNNSDVSLDGHSLTPDEIHHEMGGAWIGYNFEESFNYKGFTIYRSGLNHCAEEIKVVGSNNGTDWTTLHTVSDIEPSDYNDWGAPTTFETGDYVAEKYDKYRVIATKVISGNYWELAHPNIVGVKSYTKIRTVDPTHTLHVSGNSLFIGPVTISGNSRLKGDHLVIGVSFLKKSKDYNYELDLRYEDQEGLIDKIASFTVNKRF